MNAITGVHFGNSDAVNRAKAANLAYERAIEMGYCRTTARQFARVAKKEAHEWENPRETALRVVLPPRATFAGPGGAA